MPLCADDLTLTFCEVRNLAFDGTLMFGTGIDNGGFERDVKQLSTVASVAVGNITSNIVSQMSAAMAQIPQQMVAVGSGFEASMSQVAATMGITSAAAEFETLSAAAKEMGESTKFSASQAGEALNYLALAGYDANKAVSALPTVLNVAAAGGMELASASDMITDAMSALGLETSQMSDFADKLAVTSQKSNTSVSQLGEAILTVGGTAKTLSGGVTEMNTALGILADNGIKGSEGGTMLRNVILSLSAPTSTAAAALESLGVTAFDAQGNMRLIQDTFSDLNTALSKLSQQEQTEVLSEIFNKVDLKGVNALLGTSAERFDELSGYIDNCSGAAEAMAKTMDDNLKGDLTILGSALEGLGIAAYEKFQTPFREAVQAVTEDLGTLTESLTEGELSESFDKVSEGLSSLVSSVSEFVSSDVIPTVVTGLATIIEHSNELLGLIAGIGAAVAVWKFVPVLESAISKIKAANLALNALAAETGAAYFETELLHRGLSLTEVTVGLLTGKLSLAKAAEILLGVEINKTTVAAIAQKAALAGIAAIAIGAAVAFKKYVDNMETAAAIDPWEAQSQKAIAALEEEQRAYNEMLASKKKSNAADDAEINNIQSLWNELKGYVDETGKVISNNERASQIIGLLNENYGMNIDYINGQINGYSELANGMDAYIEKLRTEARIRNGQDAYDEAIHQQDEYVKKRAELEDELKRKEAAFSASNNADVKNIFASEANGLRTQILLLDESAKVFQQEIEEFEGLYLPQNTENNYVAGAWRNSDYTNKYNADIQALADEQVENTKLLKAAWEKAEHDYAVGVITSERDLYAQKSALLEQYGNADLEEHWKYYEDLYSCEQDFAKESAEAAKKAADEAAEARKQQMSDEWNSIERMQSIGVLSAEDAYKKQLAFIEKYCAEYSDKWYEYYQTIIEYQQQAQEKQVDSVKENIGELVAEYKSAYSDLESDIKSYKSRLMSVGDLFSVDTDKNGNTVVSVENMRSQMAEMQKYHDYVSKLKSRGASRELISELTSMDFENGSFTAKNLANMSDAEFEEINNLYSKKQQLADKLSKELYEPDMQELNDDLVNGIIKEFGTLPAEIQAIGAEALQSFIDGLSAGDISENVNNFTEQFAADCKNGIEKAFENTELNFAALMKNDNYSIGKSAGEEYVKGFNEAISQVEQVQLAVASEQSHMSVSTSSEKQYHSAKSENNSNKNSEKIVLKNYVNTTVELDKKAIGKASYEYEKEHERQADQ